MKAKSKNIVPPEPIPPTTPPIAEPEHLAGENLQEQIRRRAYELYEHSGYPGGREIDHWLQAEREILGGHHEIQ